MQRQPEPVAAPRRILVTGGGGFIGAHLVRRCVAEGDDVHVLLRPATDAWRLADLVPAIGVHRLSLADRAALRACLDEVRPTHIYHLATTTSGRREQGISSVAASLADLADLMALLEAAATSTHPPGFFARAGSIAEYGEAPPPFREDQRECPTTGYAAGIVAGTHYAEALAPTLPFPIVTARLGLVYGAGQAPDFLLPGLISACLSGQAYTMLRPLDRRDIIHVHDVVEALLRLAGMRGMGSGIVNIGSGETIGVAELAELIAKLAGADASIIRRMPQDDPVVLQLDIGKARSLDGWAPRIPLVDGLTALIADMRGRVAEAA